MQKTVAEIVCDFVSRDKSIEELAVELGEVKLRINREILLYGEHAESVFELKRIEELQEKLFIHSTNNKGANKPIKALALKIVTQEPEID
jgi:hypothetical protein